MKANNFKNKLAKTLENGYYWNIRSYEKVIFSNGNIICNCFSVDENLYITISDVYIVIYNKNGEIEDIRDTKDYKNEMEATIDIMYMIFNKLP